jgi:hypothetical protein
MPKFDANEFRSLEEYRLAAESFARLSGRLLFGFARHPLDVKNRILQNFLARTITMVRSVMALWEMGNSQDCWVIHRCIVDRYFHLVSLGKTASYQTFDDWSFMKQFDAQNRVRSDPSCQGILTSPLFTPTPEQRTRYASLAKSPPQWRRPKAEDVAKELNLQFLYTYSFDYASCHVHPMANDGAEDFFTITKLEPKPNFPSQISVLHNSLLVGCLLINEVLNQSDFKWRADVYDFYHHLARHLDDGSSDYVTTMRKIASLGPEVALCEP